MSGNTVFAVWVKKNMYMSSDAKNSCQMQPKALEEGLNFCCETLISTKLLIPTRFNALHKD